MTSEPSHKKNKASQKPFGFKNVDTHDKLELVKGVFSRVAKSYDFMNDVMSFGMHRHWKNELIQMLRPRGGMHLLDMAGGTGDIALRFLKSTESFAEKSKVTVCDYNQDMLDEGRRKALNKGIITGIDWVQIDAADLSKFSNDTFDAYTISFGLRNVTEIEKALTEAYRVLKPGGQFFCMEFSKVTSEPLEKLYNFYSFKMIPKMGEVIAKDKEAYDYLVESISRFPNQEVLAAMIKKAGFQSVTWCDLNKGIVAIHSAIKL